MVETKVINTESYETLQQEVMQLNRVLVIGLGQLGLPVAEYIKQRGGFDVYGYDISSKAMDRAQTTAGIKKATNFSDFDVYILCISTHKPEDMFSPQIEGLLSIIDKISKEAKNGALVSIESTIPKGTSKKVFEMLNHRLNVAHAPHRWYALEEKEHGVNQLRVVGGVCDCCLRAAMQFYDGSQISSLSSSSSSELESQQGTAAALQSAQTRATRDDILKMTMAATTVTANGDRDDCRRTFDNAAPGRRGSTDLQSASRSSNPAAAAVGSAAGTGDTTNGSTKRTSLGIPMHPVAEIEIAELTKIIENA